MGIKKVKLNNFTPTTINNRHCILVDKDLLKTPKGFVIESSSPALCDRIKQDFDGAGDIFVENGIIRQPMIVSAYVFASTKRDFMDNKRDDFRDEISNWIPIDPVFSPSAGHPVVSMFQDHALTGVRDYLSEQGIMLTSWNRYSEVDKNKLLDTFLKEVNKLSSAQKSVLINLSCPTGGNFVATILYLMNKISSRQWSNLIFSKSQDVVRLIDELPSNSIFSTQDNLENDERESIVTDIISTYEDNCKIASLYLAADDN